MYKDLRDLREVLRGWMREFHHPSLFLADQVSQKHKETLKLVQKSKQDYYQKIASEVNAQNVWQIRSWTKWSKTFASPPIHTGNNTPPAITHKEKCKTLCKHLFPKPLTLPEEPPINLTPNAEDIEYTLVTKREVRDAIFTAAQLNAPGISGLTG